MTPLLKERTWIGGYLKSGEWAWTDGSKWDYTNWGKGSPSGGEQYVEIIKYGDGMQWNDAPNVLSYKRGVLCQYKPGNNLKHKQKTKV